MTRNLPTKVVVRRLPPKLKADDFIRIVDPLPAHNYFRFCDADDTLGALGLTRAYINFSDIDALFDFKERFDGYTFVDCDGNESCAIVEFAVNQELASSKGSSDAAGETSETESKKTPWEVILDEIQNREAVVTQTQTITPLLAYLNSRGGDRRKEEESSRHRQFKPVSVAIAKAKSRADKPTRIPPAVRRSHDVKRNSIDRSNANGVSAKEGSHHNNKEEDLAATDSKTQKSHKSEKLSVVLDADEFPAMQSVHQRQGKSTSQRCDRPSAWVSNNSDAVFDKPNAPVSKNSVTTADSRTCTKTSESVSDSKSRSSRAQTEGTKIHERVVDLGTKESPVKNPNGQILNSQNEATCSEYSSSQDGTPKSKKSIHHPPTNPTRKAPSKPTKGRYDSDASMQNYGTADDQENEFSYDRFGSFSKSGSRGRDSRRGITSSHETYSNASRDSYRGSQHYSRETSGRGYDYGGDSGRSDYYSDQYNANTRYSSRNQGSSGGRGRVNSMGTGGYRRPSGYSSRGRGF
uniref:UPF3 domain-containing protein n=1 Tax=Trichobilharzia regenti TaxID=157069 RepID=A0AA85ITI9_TRIRE|nr:unnamed protein product [Trichobilharzia regenti]